MGEYHKGFNILLLEITEILSDGFQGNHYYKILDVKVWPWRHQGIGLHVYDWNSTALWCNDLIGIHASRRK